MPLTPNHSPTYPPATWRLVIHDATDGATNMALDEAILNAVTSLASRPTLRLYAWSPPCLSLGRGQPLADANLSACRDGGVDVVRRPTGGRAILHTDELTYSVALLQDDPRASGGIVDSYRRLSEGLLAGLRLLGANVAQATGKQPSAEGPSPVCFEVPSDYEIISGNRKLVGSAQWRAKGGVLQHGSLPLCGDLGRIVDWLHLATDEQAAQRQEVRDRATTLENELGRLVSFDEVAQALVNGFGQAHNLSFERGQVTDDERIQASELRRERYASQSWTDRV